MELRFGGKGQDATNCAEGSQSKRRKTERTAAKETSHGLGGTFVRVGEMLEGTCAEGTPPKSSEKGRSSKENLESKILDKGFEDKKKEIEFSDIIDNKMIANLKETMDRIMNTKDSINTILSTQLKEIFKGKEEAILQFSRVRRLVNMYGHQDILDIFDAAGQLSERISQEQASGKPVEDTDQETLKTHNTRVKTFFESTDQLTSEILNIRVSDCLSKYNREEIFKVFDNISTTSMKIRQKLKSGDTATLEASISRLGIYERQGKNWYDYVHGTFVEGQKGLEKPKSTGTKEWHEASKGRRPTDPELMAAFAECQRRIKLGIDLKVDDIYSRFGHIPYALCKPGERDDVTDVIGSDGERVRVMHINKGDAGATLIFPLVGKDGDLKDIWKRPYRAAISAIHGNGSLPTQATTKSLGFTWGPWVLQNSHVAGEMQAGLYKHFSAHNDINNPQDKKRWIQFNQHVTAPPGREYSLRTSDLTAEDICKALENGVPDKPVKYGNGPDSGAGRGNEFAGFWSGIGGFSFMVPARNTAGEIKLYPFTGIVVPNFGRLRFLDIAGVHLEDALPESKKQGVREVERSQNKEGAEKGSVGCLLITSLPLSSHTLEELALAAACCYSKYSTPNAPLSHDAVVAISVADTGLPKDPNFDTGITLETAPPLNLIEDLPKEYETVIKELAKQGLEKGLLASLLASRDMTMNGYTGNSLPQEETAKAFYYTNRFAPALKPIEDDQIPDGIDKAKAKQQVQAEEYSRYYSESDLSDSESE